MKRLIVATRNSGKLREIQTFLSDLPYQCVSLHEVHFTDEINETGKTYKENAETKARTVGEKTGLLTIADDSGLEIDALGGKPGVQSARYAPGSDQDRLMKVLEELHGIPNEKRKARYVSVVALFNPDERKTMTFKGQCEGYITAKPVGTNGFGYDPIFFSPKLRKTFGEATFTEKQSVDHRVKALIRVKQQLLLMNG